MMMQGSPEAADQSHQSKTHTYAPMLLHVHIYIQLIANCWENVAELRGKNVFVTGHSLGGGFSIFASIKLWKVRC